MLNNANITGFNFSRLTLQETVDQVEQWACSGNQRSEDGGGRVCECGCVRVVLSHRESARI